MANRTRPLRVQDYLSDAGNLSLGRLVDDAVAALGCIRSSGVGRQRGRSRGVIFRSFKKCAEAGGYSPTQSHFLWRDQVLALDTLEINAE